MVDVAQLVESRIVIPVVVGSSPISHPNNQIVSAYCYMRLSDKTQFELLAKPR